MQRSIHTKDWNVLTMDELTAELTAFPSFEKFAAAMRDGYIPTLQTQPARRGQRRVIERNERIEELAYRLQALGFKVWKG